jgi:hypothetical protein
MRARFSRCFRASRTLSFLLIATAAVIGFTPIPASAQGTPNKCIQDEYNSYNGTSKTLSCTAGDVTVAGVTGEKDLNGNPLTSCLAGTNFSFIADFTIQTTSNKTRSNVGLFFGTGGQTQALTGNCDNFVLSPTYTCPATVGTAHPQTCGDATYEELDGAINGETAATSTTAGGCGDTSSTDNNGLGTQFAELELDDVTCPTNPIPCPPGVVTPPGVTTCMALPECTGWYQPTNTMPECTISPADSFAWPSTAVPGTSSKCSCTTLYIPVQPVSPAVTVNKYCTTDNSPGNNSSCDAGPSDPSSTVTYTVSILNSSSAGGVDVDQICDNVYGQIYTAPGVTASCPVGSGCTSPNNVVGGTCDTATTCPTTAIDVTSTTTPFTCTFTATQTELKTVTDHISVYGHSDLATTTPVAISPNPTNSTNVVVTSGDAQSSATISKGLSSTTNACMTARYNVTISNTATGTTDEALTLQQTGTPGNGGYVPAITDTHYGDITTTHGSATADGSVLGTTCGSAVGGTGQGTFSSITICNGTGCGVGTAPGGSFTTPIEPGGTYQCQFDGVICGAPQSVQAFHTGTCSIPAGETNGTCTNPGATTPAGGCTLDSQCDTTCNGITETDSVTAMLAADDAVCNTSTNKCTAGNVGATCTSNSQCSLITPTPQPTQLVVNECIASYTNP